MLGTKRDLALRFRLAGLQEAGYRTAARMLSAARLWRLDRQPVSGSNGRWNWSGEARSMARKGIWLIVLVLVLAGTTSTDADYEAGSRAWRSGQPTEALKQWQEAARSGDSRAMLALGRLYVKGLGSPQDYVRAHMWFNLAASRGESRAIRERDALARKMTAAERAEAQKLARTWRPGSPAASPAETPDRGSVEGSDRTGAGPPPARAIREAQRLLTGLGYRPGKIDGIWGRRASRAYMTFLRDVGRSVSGTLTPQGLRALRETAATRGKPAAKPAAPIRQQAGDLLRSVRDGDIDGTRLILQAGTNPDIRDRRGWTPLMYAASKGYKVLVPSLLEARSSLDLQAADGATALFLAVLQGHEEIAEMLVRAGADPTIKGPTGRTPIDVARVRKLVKTFALLKRASTDHSAFSAARKSGTAAAYKKYLDGNPRGLFVEQARERQGKSLDREAFLRAEKANAARVYRDYLAAYPGGQHRDTAEQRVLQLDSEEFDRAVKSDSAAAYREYLASNANGMFVEEARRRKDVSADREGFAQSKARHTLEAYTAYLSSFPKGSYRSQTQDAVRKLKDPVVFARAKSQDTITAYEHYLKLYPQGSHAAEARLRRDRVQVEGRVFRDCDICPVMVVLPAGSFLMGSDEGDADEQPLHRVTIEKPFAVGKYEVTLRQFTAFVRATGRDMGEKPGLFGLPSPEACESPGLFISTKITWSAPGFDQDDNSPAVCINWNDAIAYTRWLSQETGKLYRLLSEAEWEYAARATTRGEFHFGEILSPNQANYNSTHSERLSKGKKNRRRAIKVGSFPANGFGLHDMHGNVLEWVEDCWHENYEGAPADGRAWIRKESCTARVVRGGSWHNPASYLRSAFRNSIEVKKRHTQYGFRVARAVDPHRLLSKPSYSRAEP